MSMMVSCILATRNRTAFARQAIRCFLGQTYDQSELIVVDDGEERVEHLCAGLYRVRYIRLDEPATLGKKLNIGIQHAEGTTIQKLDDDDYYHPDFLERAISALAHTNPARTLVAWDCFSILLVGEKQARYSGHGWAAGGTLCFHRALWARGSFRDVPSQVDTFLIQDHRPSIVKVCAPELYMLVRHGRNTWTQMSDGADVNAYFRRLPLYSKPLDDFVEPLDARFYRSLKTEGVE
jgi:glycosyltransferase involved in cell wall biosynthesis